MKRASILVFLLIGCGDPSESVGPTGTGGAGSSPGTGGISVGGTGGAGGMPTNPGDYGPITAADAMMCEEWPLCPDGVYAFRPGDGRASTDIINRTCGDRGVVSASGDCVAGTATDPADGTMPGQSCLLPCRKPESCNIRVCGDCTDYRTKACQPFVARCRAPMWVINVCGNATDKANFDNGVAFGKDTGFYRQCTGNSIDPSGLAVTACGKP